MFDGKFRPDMVALWDAFSNDFGGGLGHESALVVDLKGAAPAVPGIPQAGGGQGESAARFPSSRRSPTAPSSPPRGTR